MAMSGLILGSIQLITVGLVIVVWIGAALCWAWWKYPPAIESLSVD